VSECKQVVVVVAAHGAKRQEYRSENGNPKGGGG